MRIAAQLLLSEQLSKFDSDFLLRLAEAPGEIVKCAVYLFMGYIDGTVQFAQGSGGWRRFIILTHSNGVAIPTKTIAVSHSVAWSKQKTPPLPQR